VKNGGFWPVIGSPWPVLIFSSRESHETLQIS
jgi:hypothetical protein